MPFDSSITQSGQPSNTAPDNEPPMNIEAQTIGNKIRNCSAWLSLEAERRVARDLSDQKWSVTHSCFFTDPETNKLREVDVVAHQSWERVRRTRHTHCQLNLVVECKSASGYHILFSAIREPSWAQPHLFTLGQEGDNETFVTDRLRDVGLTDAQILEVMHDFKRYSYPDGRLRTRLLAVEPPPAPYHAAAFREHNIGSEKELDASVLWKAQMTLTSALTALKAADLRLLFEDLPGEIQAARLMKDDIVQAAFEYLHLGIDFAYLYHPVLVIEAPLWIMQGKRPAEIPWCRLHRQSAYGHSRWWFDVVSSKAFEQYAALVTAHYSKHLRRVGAKKQSI